jgi:hypothetical protein
MIRLAATATLLVALASPAAAVVTITGAITGGTTPGTFVHLDPAPAAVGGDNLNSVDLFAFVERLNVTLPAMLVTDLGGPITAGTKVSSFGVAFDPKKPELFVEGFVTFPRPILGVLTSTLRLKNTDALLGAPGTTYNSPGARGLDNFDIPGTFFVGNTLFLDWKALSPGDNVRVLTAAIPEPTTWAMLVAGFGLIGFASRRRRIAVSA